MCTNEVTQTEVHSS